MCCRRFVRGRCAFDQLVCSQNTLHLCVPFIQVVGGSSAGAVAGLKPIEICIHFRDEENPASNKDCNIFENGFKDLDEKAGAREQKINHTANGSRGFGARNMATLRLRAFAQANFLTSRSSLLLLCHDRELFLRLGTITSL